MVARVCTSWNCKHGQTRTRKIDLRSDAFPRPMSGTKTLDKVSIQDALTIPVKDMTSDSERDLKSVFKSVPITPPQPPLMCVMCKMMLKTHVTTRRCACCAAQDDVADARYNDYEPAL